MKLKYFKLSDFDSPDQKGSGKNMQFLFLLMLERAREIAGIPFVITSAFRTWAHHAAIYAGLGKPPVLNSFHLKGQAVDIAYNTPEERDTIIRAAAAAGFRGFGIGRTFIHIDSRENFAIWDYDSIDSSITEYYRQNIPKWIKPFNAKRFQINVALVIVVIVVVVLNIYYWPKVKKYLFQ